LEDQQQLQVGDVVKYVLGLRGKTEVLTKSEHTIAEIISEPISGDKAVLHCELNDGCYPPFDRKRSVFLSRLRRVDHPEQILTLVHRLQHQVLDVCDEKIEPQHIARKLVRDAMEEYLNDKYITKSISFAEFELLIADPTAERCHALVDRLTDAAVEQHLKRGPLSATAEHSS